MHDVFISYSHHDRSFAARLRAALTDAGNAVFVDDEDIPPASRWADDIKTAVEGADAFVFVLTPASASSAECRKELDHAVSLNKRIIPVNLRETPISDIPISLGIHQFVPARGLFEDDFDRCMSLLLNAVNTDLDWVRQHTQWGNKAIEWEEHGRDRSFLLSGIELAAAEGFLNDSAGREPEPTQLQNNYVLMSRQTTTRRQRKLLSGVTIALVVAIILATIALVLRSDAVSNEQTAQSRQAAASSEQELGSNPEVSTLLAMAGLRIRDTVQAERALRDALPDLQVLQILSLPGAVPAKSATWSPNGKLVVTTDGNGQARVWDIADGHSRALRVNGTSEITSAAFSPGGKTIATTDDNGEVRIWDGTNDVQTRHFGGGPSSSDSSGGLYHLAWLSRTEIITVGEDGAVQLWNPIDGKQVGTTFNYSAIAPVLNVAVDAKGNEIALASEDGTALVDYPSRRPSVIDVSGAVTSLALSPNGSELVTADGDGTARVWTLPTDRLRTTFGFKGGPIIQSVSFNQNATQVITAGHDGAAQIWDVASGRLLLTLSGHTGIVNSAAFNPRGNEVVTAGDDGTARIWDANPRQSNLIVTEPGEAELDDIAFSSNGRLFATASGQDGSVRIWNGVSGSAGPVFQSNDDEGVATVAFDPRAAQVLIAGYENHGNAGPETEAWIMSLATGKSRALGGGSPGELLDATYNRTGTEVVTTSSAGAVQLWNLHDPGHGRLLVAASGVPADTAVFSPNDLDVLVASEGGEARIFDIRSGKAVGRPIVARGRAGLLTASYNYSGKEIVTSASDGVARVWRVSTRSQIASFTEPGGASISDAAFNPAGSEVVTSDDDGTARVWDVSTGRQLTELGDQGAASIVVAVFNSSGNEVATADQWGRAIIWSTELASPLPTLERIARSWAFAKLTAKEARMYLPGIKN